jgi:prolyl oligopeptidase
VNGLGGRTRRTSLAKEESSMPRPVLAVVALALLPLSAPAQEDDPYLWLEEVDGQKALAWVKEQNRLSTAELEAVPEFAEIRKRALEIYDSQDRIPTPALRGSLVDNFWQDQEHERGVFRRTSLQSYRTASPSWETLLDLDAMTKADGVPWAYKGSDCLAPEFRRCLVNLSRGGADAAEVRELDTASKAFVEDGFYLPEAKSGATWRDADSLLVATDFGEGSLTTSGYPRRIKLWRRGTPLSQAQLLLEGSQQDMGVWPACFDTPDERVCLVLLRNTFFSGQTFLLSGTRLVRLDVPDDADVQGVFRGRLLLSLRTDWKVGDKSFPEGSLVAARLDGLLQGHPHVESLFEPSPRVSLAQVASTFDRVVITTLDNVHSRMYRLTPAEGGWSREEVALPGLGTAGIGTTSDVADQFFYTYEDFLTPSALYFVDAGRTEKVKSLPAVFDASGVEVKQHEAVSRDGTRIPYFLVTPKGYKADGTAPTLLYGYGGFEISMVPEYDKIVGAAWIERGGVYALANLRGGGEFGPAWHKAAMKENHIHNFEDFAAVAEDLVARKVTTSRHLGIMGGSQGGLLVGGTFTLHPDLFHAVVCQVPLLDMKRYHKLLAGASWMDEYGNPDLPEDWAYIRTWSPYQQLEKDVVYPKVFFWTNTRDDRVHPGHARKMVARMLEQGHPVYYFENTEGGHGSGSVNSQRAYIRGLEFAYLWKMLR